MFDGTRTVDEIIADLKQHFDEYSPEYCIKVLNLFKDMSELLESKIDCIHDYIGYTKDLMESFIGDDPEWTREMQEWFAEKYKLPRAVMKKSCEYIEAVQSDMRSLKAEMAYLLAVQRMELREALPLARQRQDQKIIEQWHGRKGGISQRYDWPALGQEVKVILRTHKRLKAMSDVYRELERQRKENPALKELPSKRQFQRRFKDQMTETNPDITPPMSLED